VSIIQCTVLIHRLLQYVYFGEKIEEAVFVLEGLLPKVWVLNLALLVIRRAVMTGSIIG